MTNETLLALCRRHLRDDDNDVESAVADSELKALFHRHYHDDEQDPDLTFEELLKYFASAQQSDDPTNAQFLADEAVRLLNLTLDMGIQKDSWIELVVSALAHASSNLPKDDAHAPPPPAR
jgi:hypothetical protein